MLNDYPRKQLQNIILQFGSSVCDDPERCETLLRDFCFDHKRELNLLIAALKEHIPQELLKAPAYASSDFTINLLSRHLRDNLGLAEHLAQWAVESWAMALSLDILQQAPIIRLTTTTTVSTKSDWIESKLGMEFVWIPEGSFKMGSPDEKIDRRNDEKQHNVEIERGFYLGKYLVTQAQWQAVMGGNPSYFKGEHLPVENVSCLEVQTFIAQLNHLTHQNYRLPTEAQWEYAARAGTTSAFYTGYIITSQQANYGQNISKTTRVGSYAANPWGLYDMAGNVSEWTASVYDVNYQGSTQCADNNDSNKPRVIRGGSWSDLAFSLRSANRNCYAPDYHFFFLGFRLARM